MEDDEEEKLTQLKTLYDELWKDARTMIKDMKGSILMYFFSGIVMISLSFILFGISVYNWSKILSGDTGMLNYFYAIVTTFSTVVCPISGATWIWWYYKLKNRYSKLIQIEKN